MQLRLLELQNKDGEAKKLRSTQSPEVWRNIKGILHHHGFLYISEIICSKIISYHHNNPLAGHFGIKKTRELIAKKYLWPTFYQDIETHDKGCNIRLASNAVCFKSYGDFQLLSIPTYHWINLFIDFVTGQSPSVD